MSLDYGGRVHLILDFDGTIIKNQSTPVLDYLRQYPNAPSYDSFLEPFMQDYNKHKQNYIPSESEQTTLQQIYDYLDSLVVVEKSSIERIEAAGWLEGVIWSDDDVSVFDNAAREIQKHHELVWRPGLSDLIDNVWFNHGQVDILSVGWSGQFIRALLKQQLGRDFVLEGLTIYANEIDKSGSGHFSRVMQPLIQADVPRLSVSGYKVVADRPLWTAGDKAAVMSDIRKTVSSPHPVIYVGDSKTDLRCIMDADLGVRVRDVNEPTSEQIGLEAVLDKLHVEQMPVDKLVHQERHTNFTTQMAVGYLSDFKELTVALFQRR